MGAREYLIKVRVEFDDETKYDMMQSILRNSARKLLTQTTMIADARRPQIMIESESFVDGHSTISMMDDPDVQRPPQ